MTEDAGLAPSAESAAPASGEYDINAALADLAARREKQSTAVEETPADEIPARDEPAPDDSQPSGEVQETVQDDPPAEPDPIEPPRSWTKEEKAEFLTYPREAQERIARREQEREAALRNGQNETAEQRKKAEAEIAEAKKLRDQYESALPTLLQHLQQSYNGEFADIKSPADAMKLAEDDFVRYVKWDAHQKQLAHVANELKQAQDRAMQEQREAFKTFADEQDKLFEKTAPEFADQEKAPKARKLVTDYISSLGVNQEQLAALWNGEQTVSLRHHLLQSVLYDAARYQAAQKALKTTPPKPVPPVQKPGAAPAPNAGLNAEIARLSKALNDDPENIDIAVKLRQARRNLQARGGRAA